MAELAEMEDEIMPVVGEQIKGLNASSAVVHIMQALVRTTKGDDRETYQQNNIKVHKRLAEKQGNCNLNPNCFCSLLLDT